ncbi:dihydrofolate reductase family protein [Arthrobacter sedimenti]|uniref:dihydrofolate reductase family protein n=1 Tax=Arthrobacter sedimenti TaxID=2694931 RepID=UPI000B3633D8|nr:dihydrofolate reductase family protein [Arthrobacter sedimenti]OUM41163.1 deaminase [Arthrobacter agilis]
MTRVIYYTASTLNGFLADEHNSLDWLFAVEPPPPGLYERFLGTVGVLVEGSTTYEWVLDFEGLLADPGKWRTVYGERPTFVFTTRDLPVPDGADVRLVSGDVRAVFGQLREAAGDGDIWVVGGGDLAGQFLAAGLLDEIQVSIAPVALTGGAPLLPLRVESDRLTLRSVEQQGQFAFLTYDVARASGT